MSEYEPQTAETCKQSLNGNLTGLLVAAVFEVLQDMLDIFNNSLGLLFIWNWFFQWFGLLRLDLG